MKTESSVGNFRQRLDRNPHAGDPHQGFARIYCNACRHDFLLAISC